MMIPIKIRKPKIILAISFIVILFTGCSQFSFGADSGPERSDFQIVEIDPAHQTCEIAADCITTYVDCSGCECGIPINIKYEAHYRDLYQDLCADYAGPVCEMYCPPITLTCLSGICAAGPSE